MNKITLNYTQIKGESAHWIYVLKDGEPVDMGEGRYHIVNGKWYADEPESCGDEPIASSEAEFIKVMESRLL